MLVTAAFALATCLLAAGCLNGGGSGGGSTGGVWTIVSLTKYDVAGNVDETVVQELGADGSLQYSDWTYEDGSHRILTYDEFDEHGKPTHYTPFNAQKFSEAATKISNAFEEFMKTLAPAMQKLTVKGAQIIAIMGKGIKPLMESIQQFTDMTLAFMYGKTIEETDEHGRKIKREIQPVKPTDFIKAGQNIAEAFTSFIDKIWTAFSKEGYTTPDAWYKKDAQKGNKLAELLTSLENIKTLVDNVDSFVKLITNTVEQTKDIDLKT